MDSSRQRKESGEGKRVRGAMGVEGREGKTFYLGKSALRLSPAVKRVKDKRDWRTRLSVSVRKSNTVEKKRSFLVNETPA